MDSKMHQWGTTWDRSFHGSLQCARHFGYRGMHMRKTLYFWYVFGRWECTQRLWFFLSQGLSSAVLPRWRNPSGWEDVRYHDYGSCNGNKVLVQHSRILWKIIPKLLWSDNVEILVLIFRKFKYVLLSLISMHNQEKIRNLFFK